MNIFAVDPCPAASARALHDSHVVKMTLESAQLLCGPHSGAPMKRTHWNHPCAVWARASRANYLWLLDHALALAAEYRERFKRQHGALPAILWCAERVGVVRPGPLLPHAQAMPDEYRGPCAHAAYRRYYLACKMADRRGRPQRWRCPPPSWMADRVERAGSLWVASGRLQEARGGAGEYRGSGRARAGRLEPPARVLVVT